MVKGDTVQTSQIRHVCSYIIIILLLLAVAMENPWSMCLEYIYGRCGKGSFQPNDVV